ncbi:MAG: hypothetical protein JXA73_12270 [Acidobacteria bacterium]|nr:hypothetical protein [Acidobacteriota bacterium]
MPENISEEDVDKPKPKILKYYLRAAIVGAIAALSGAFAYCVYDGYVRLHEGLCNCAKYAAFVTAAFSHPIVIIGAFAGISVLSLVYLIKVVFKIFRHHRCG